MLTKKVKSYCMALDRENWGQGFCSIYEYIGSGAFYQASTCMRRNTPQGQPPPFALNSCSWGNLHDC